jgi:hypothetical protein
MEILHHICESSGARRVPSCLAVFTGTCATCARRRGRWWWCTRAQKTTGREPPRPSGARSCTSARPPCGGGALVRGPRPPARGARLALYDACWMEPGQHGRARAQRESRGGNNASAGEQGEPVALDEGSDDQVLCTDLRRRHCGRAVGGCQEALPRLYWLIRRSGVQVKDRG